MFSRVLVVMAIMLWVQSPALSDSNTMPPAVSLSGIGPNAISITPEVLTGLPMVERDITFQTSKGMSSGHYKGVLVWDVLKAQKAFDGLQHNAELKKTLLVKASDGYEIVFSIGEIHPDFGNSPVMLVTEINGEPVKGRGQFVVPGDKRGARAIHDIVSIELR
ncbi:MULTISPECIES: hypothetical protein [Mesorhizobium]|nr:MULTISPECIES: hypothetical protein [Mesorhizobium]